MQDWSIRQRAEYIFRTGKLIHERVFSLQGCQNERSPAVRELSIPQYHLLLTVRQLGRPSMSELARRLGVAPPSVSAMVDRLVDKGCLLRQQCAEDRRKIQVQLTPVVEHEVAGIEESLVGSFVELVDKLGPETSCKWCQVLQEIQAVLESESRAESGEEPL